MIGKIAYTYFRNNPKRGQIVIFMMLGNEQIREFNAYLFNDSLLTIYLIASVYVLVIKGRPFFATLLFSLGLSVKAGAMLLVPSLFGWIMY